ncbi:hypothetical protein HZS_603 [Henneguya salminicola]|nr:hypothetical protein HZS_603 [Henneguya salminicola]
MIWRAFIHKLNFFFIYWHMIITISICLSEILIFRLMHTYSTLNESSAKHLLVSSIQITDLDIFYESQQLFSIIDNVEDSFKEILLIYLDLLNTKKSMSTDLVVHIKNIYHGRCKDIRFLGLILQFLTKNEVLDSLPDIMIQSDNLVKHIISRIFELSISEPPFILSPIELVIAIHKMEDRVEMKSLTKTITIFLSHRDQFGQELLAVTLQQLVDSNPIPILTLRTMIQALGMCPKLISFIMGLLQKLVTKQVWKQPKLWHGFVKCCEKTKPQSLSILLQLPIRYFEETFQICPELHPLLVNHVKNMGANQRALIHKSVLNVLEKDSRTFCRDNTTVESINI